MRLHDVTRSVHLHGQDITNLSANLAHRASANANGVSDPYASLNRSVGSILTEPLGTRDGCAPSVGSTRAISERVGLRRDALFVIRTSFSADNASASVLLARWP